MKTKFIQIAILIYLALGIPSLFSEDIPDKSQIEVLENTKLYSLVGDWKISHRFSERFKLNEYNDSDWDSIHIPASWIGSNRNEIFGWYRIHLFIGNKLRGSDLGFIPPNFLEASEIYFNGVLIGKLGVIASDGTLIQNNPRADFFRIDQKLVRYNDDNLIAVKTANLSGGAGGTQNISYFGEFDLCKTEFNRHVIYNSAFAISMIGLGIYHLVIFLRLRNDKVYLYYSGIVFSVASFVIFVYRFNYWFLESFYLHFFLVAFSLIFGTFSVYLFACSFFEYKFTRVHKIILFFYFWVCVLEILPIFFPSLFLFRNKYLIRIHTLINILFIFAAMGLLIKAFLEKRPGWNIIVVGTTVSFPLFFWDSFKAMDLIHQNNWAIIENCFVITITFAVAISKKYSTEYEKLLQIEKQYADDLKLDVADKTNNLLKINEELKEANLIKNKLFSIISQTLRNPLENLDQVLYLFKKKKYSNIELKKNFSMVSENLKRNRFLLENLLNWSYSQIEDKGELEMNRLDLIPILEETILFFQTEAKNKNIEILPYFKKNTYVFSDQNSLRLIFMNLFSNAIKFTPKHGTILIEVKKQKSFVCIEIADSGIGISDILLEKILIKNELISTIGTENEKGTGLGLKIVKDLIDKVGGTFLLETKVNVGTKIKVKLRAEEYGKN
ncbi:MAG: sensor histidine kinase [Leptospiraceae bacterium]|nr:sensor histidine kinase [Leptospiraceae bacterium]